MLLESATSATRPGARGVEITWARGGWIPRLLRLLQSIRAKAVATHFLTATDGKDYVYNVFSISNELSIMSPSVKGSPGDGEWSIPSLREPRYSQSLERGLAILGCFTSERLVLGIADIADDLGMSRSTTHRYAITLVALGFLKQDALHKYRLSRVPRTLKEVDVERTDGCDTA